MNWTRRAHIAFVPLLASAAFAADTAPRRPSKEYTIEQFMATTSVTGASFSADEKRVLFSSNATGIYNVYSVPVAGGPATHVTRSSHELGDVSGPRGARMIAVSSSTPSELK